MSVCLETNAISAGYDGSAVLHQVSIRVAEGDLVALIGSNGAGKTTLMRAITGLLTPTSGNVILDGKSLAGTSTAERVELGIALSPEGRQLFSNLTVEKCLLLGSYPRHARPHRAVRMEQVMQLFPRLRERRSQRAGTLSGGEQQMVAIGRALMSCPRILLLDEPSLGLAPILVGTLLESIRHVVAAGTGVLLVEQNVRAALSVASRGYVLAEGRITLEGSSSELLANERFFSSFLGHELPAAPAA